MLHFGNVEKEIEKEQEIEQEKEQEIEQEIELEEKTKSLVELLQNPVASKIIKYYEENISQITPASAEVILPYLEDFDYNLIIEAIKMAALANKPRADYINGILRNWKNSGYKVLADLQKESKQKEQKEETEEEETARRVRELNERLNKKNGIK